MVTSAVWSGARRLPPGHRRINFMVRARKLKLRLSDAVHNKFDTAILLSADSDLAPPINAIKKTFPEKRIVVAFPPRLSSVELSKIAHAYFQIGRAKFAHSLFPLQVMKVDGTILERPSTWQ